MQKNKTISKLWAIIVAAGSGSRMSTVLSEPKQFISFDGVPLYWHSARTFARCACVHGLVFVFPAAYCDAEKKRIEALVLAENIGLPWICTAGGEQRQDSVRNGLEALQADSPQCTAVLVHDAARPFFSPALVHQLVDALEDGGVIPALALTDTIKEVEAGQVLQTLDRNRLFAVQTPQLFWTDVLQRAHAQAQAQGCSGADDAQLLELCHDSVRIIAGEARNRKITHPEDLNMLEKKCPTCVCTGWGYDVHRYTLPEEASTKSRPMKLGGVLIPQAPNIIAHSDGDVLIHALMDALLGSIGQGDIGIHFPDSDARYENCNSAIMLDDVMRMMQAAQAQINHVDCTLIAQIPRIQPHVAAIRSTLAHLLGLASEAVNVKATTEEGLGFTGEKKGIKAVAVVSVSRGTGTGL